MSIKVIIIEDDPMVIQVNSEYVNAVPGFEVIGAAKTGEEGLKLINILQPDLVLLDIYLPDMSGVETLRLIRKQDLPTDVILVTAARDAETVQNVFRYGAIDFIVKPFKFSRLKASLENYASLRYKLSASNKLNQIDIDAMNLGLIQEKQEHEDIPKGLSVVTLKQVMLTLLKESKPLSSEEVAETVGLARVTARRYLEYLHLKGKVEVELQYGSVGRPVKRYYTC